MRVISILVAVFLPFAPFACEAEPSVLESAVYCGEGDLFGSHVGDTMTFSFSEDVSTDESMIQVTFEVATLLWEVWGDPPMSWEVSGNVLTVTATSVFSTPRDVVGDRVLSVTGLQDADGEPVVVPDGGVIVDSCP